MKRWQIVRKAGKTRLVIRGKKTQELNGREYQTIRNGGIGGILPLEIDRYEPFFSFSTDLDGFVPLNEFLGLMPLSRKHFAKILRNILQVLTAAEELHFSKGLFIYDPCYIMVEPATWNCYFVYIPLQPFDTEGTLRELLADLIQYAVFRPEEDTTYVQEYLQIVGNGPIVSLFVLEEYIRRLEAGIPQTALRSGSGGFYAGRAALVDPATGQQTPVTKLPFTIGSQIGEADFIPTVPGVSRLHAEISQKQNQFVLVDLGSRNGSFVNGKRLIPGAPEIIHSGDHLWFAGAEYRFMVP